MLVYGIHDLKLNAPSGEQEMTSILNAQLMTEGGRKPSGACQG